MMADSAGKLSMLSRMIANGFVRVDAAAEHNDAIAGLVELHRT
jgi:hypothetical protein